MRALLVVLVALSVSRPAFADEDAARVHFRHGIQLYDQKIYDRALDEFRAAYAEKPTAGLKQNIALCQKGLGEFVRAATSFDEALDEGSATLKPETKGAIAAELADLSRYVATIDIAIVDDAGRPLDGTVRVDGLELRAGAAKRPIRVTPGLHTFGVRVPGLPDPPEKHLSLLVGAPVDATFLVSARSATLTIRPSEADATITVDGKEVGKGTWTGQVSPGPHDVEIKKPGFQTTKLAPAPNAGDALDVPVVLRRPTDEPSDYYAPTRIPPKKKRGYVVIGGELDAESFRLSGMVGEVPSGVRRDFFGGAFAARGGINLSRLLAIELDFEVGAVKAKYVIPGTPSQTETTVTDVQFTPTLRFRTPGRVGFTMATGFGPYLTALEATIPRTTDTLTVKGSGLAFSWLLDMGVVVDTGPVFIEIAAFAHVHGVGPVRDENLHERLLDASPATRGGLRLGLGIPF